MFGHFTTLRMKGLTKLSHHINLGINLIFLIKSFVLYDQKSQNKNFKYLEKEKSYEDEIKSILNHFQRAFIEENKTRNTTRCNNRGDLLHLTFKLKISIVY